MASLCHCHVTIVPLSCHHGDLLGGSGAAPGVVAKVAELASTRARWTECERDLGEREEKPRGSPEAARAAPPAARARAAALRMRSDSATLLSPVPGRAATHPSLTRRSPLGGRDGAAMSREAGEEAATGSRFPALSAPGPGPEPTGSRFPALSAPGPGPEQCRTARCRRFADRRGAKRRLALGKDMKPKAALEEEQRRSHKQLEENRQRLAKLLYEATQMMTSIQVAADARETQRREEEAELNLQRVQKLEDEAKWRASKFEEIASKWASAKEMRIPQELRQLLNQQQQQCALLLERKNELIRDLQQKLKTKDKQYMEALKKQSDDIHLLVARMEEQIRTMLRTYRHKLLQTEEVFELERQELLAKNRQKWEEAIQAYKAQQLEYLQARVRQVEKYEKELKQLRLQDEEKYRSMKTELEDYVQNLAKQLQQMKAACQLNQEKLEHNIAVLELRNKENDIISKEQKRKICRLRALLRNLRTKLANQEKKFGKEKRSLEVGCKRLIGKYKDVQRRMRHLALSDAEKFTEVWLMKEEEAKELVRQAFDAGRIIHTQQLGLPWEDPSYWFLNNVGPLGLHEVKRTATMLAAEVLTESSSGEQEEEGEEEEEEEEEEVGSGAGGKENTAWVKGGVTPLQLIPTKTAKRILELVSNEAGFLIKNDLWKPLRMLGRHEQLLLKLDSIFEALQIDSEDDLYQLLDFFLKHQGQEVAVSQSQGSPDGEGVTDAGEDKEDGGCGAQRDELKSPQSLQGSLPSVNIQADDVLGILKAFLKQFEKLREKDEPAEEVPLPQERDSSKDGQYWEALAHVIPKPTLKLWDALAVALNEYYEVLKRRASLLAETAILQQQNSELCLLLEGHIRCREPQPSTPLTPGTQCAVGQRFPTHEPCDLCPPFPPWSRKQEPPPPTVPRHCESLPFCDVSPKLRYWLSYLQEGRVASVSPFHPSASHQLHLIPSTGFLASFIFSLDSPAQR
ncbi:dynein regulatory complex protein 1-like [Podargus strigoides]